MAKELTIREQRLAERHVAGDNGIEAARFAGYSGNDNTLTITASQVLSRPKVKEYIAKLREPEIRSALLSKDEKRAYLAALIRTPIGEIGPDSILCQEYSSETTGGGRRGKLKQGVYPEGNEVTGPAKTLRRVKMADKLRAIDLDSKLAGHFEAERMIVDVGQNTLEAIRERAKTMGSPMSVAKPNTPPQ